MEKWADYGIHSVKYNASHTHIDRVRAMPDNGDNFGDTCELTREEVVSHIKNGVTFITIIKNSEGKWSKGQPVHIINVNGTEYIKTEDNNSEADNLENLPEF